MNNIIIFCQQPADIPLVLSVYESHCGKNNDIYIFCTNVKNNYRFLNSLHLHIKRISFIPYKFSPRYYRPDEILKTKQYLRYLYNKYFSTFEKDDVYFFAKGHDWISFYLINRMIKKSCRINYRPRFEFNPVNIKTTIKEKLNVLLYSYLCSTKLKIISYGHGKCLFYDNPSIKTINIEINDEVFLKYSYSCNIGPKTILFIDANLLDDNSINNYQKRVVEILNELKKIGYKIYLKAHPRVGATPGIEDFITHTIPDYILGEFVDITQYDYVIGILSTVLAEYSNKNENIISLIDLFEFYDDSYRGKMKQYLIKISNNKLRFIQSLSELKRVIDYENSISI